MLLHSFSQILAQCAMRGKGNTPALQQQHLAAPLLPSPTLCQPNLKVFKTLVVQ